MAHCKADLPMVQASVSLLAMPGARWQYEEVCRRLGSLFRDNTRAVHTNKPSHNCTHNIMGNEYS